MQTYFVERFKYKYNDIKQYQLHQAVLDDVEWIAKYTIADEFFNIRYTTEGFANEMRNRLGSNYGRCWYLKDGDTTVATIQTMAEIGNVAESGLLVVNKDYRSQGIGEYMVGYLSDVVIDEGKRLFGNFTSMKGAKKYIDIDSCKLLSTLGKYYKK
jgi:predicted GNAT family acetyltransferase